MGFFKKIAKLGLDVVATPVAVVKDFATMGGAMVGEPEPFTVQQARKIAETAEEVYDSLDD